MPGLVAFAMKHIGWIVGGLGCLILGFMLHHSQGETRKANERSAAWEALFHKEQSAFRETVANVRRATAQAKADDAAHALKVEREQVNRTEERSNEYQTRLADLRRRYDALRVQQRPAPVRLSSASGSGTAPVPRVPDSTGGPDAAPEVDPFACEANTLQLEELQRWIRDQQAIPR